MKASELRARYRKIITFFARITVSTIFWDIFLSRLGLRPLARRTRTARMIKFSVQFRALAIDMGGVMIKVGQFLSSRQDVLPKDLQECNRFCECLSTSAHCNYGQLGSPTRAVLS